jgi:hypothetical protein
VDTDVADEDYLAEFYDDVYEALNRNNPAQCIEAIRRINARLTHIDAKWDFMADLPPHAA